ncbi:MAG: YARHG domain-containing protein, partial [Lachnospiraceae bacterium]|nr:YARHG domain-containing protein [Lachnospiraceae bacterium]
RAVTGEVPAESLDRVAGEKLKRPSEYGINMGKAREDTLMKGLEVYQKDRQQTVTELKKEMYVAPPGPAPGPTPIPGPVPPCEQTLLQKLLKNKKIVAGAAAVFVLFIGVAAYNGGKSKSESIEPENVLADGGSLLHDGADSKGGLETFVETEYRQQTETEYIQQTEGEKKPEVESWTDEEGNEYTGIRQNGTIQGEGICKYKDGRTYEGEFSNGFPHGKGVYTGSDGTKVVGISVNGLVTEVTKIEFSNGNRFEGSWNGDLDGDGTMYYVTGERYEGYWKNGEKDGDGIYYDKDGESSKQTWSEGTLVTDEKEEMKKKEEETEKDLLSQDYILPNSDSEYLDKSDIKGLSIKEINYAKNEIFARHGRKFKSRELQTYFNSKDWYLGTIDPDEFDNNCGSLLNKYEKKNSELLREKEFSMESGGYKLDQ